MSSKSNARMGRRDVLLGAAVVGAVGALAAPTPAAADPLGGLPILEPTDDWATTLSASSRVQLVAGATYTLTSTVELPSDCLIEGNGASVYVSTDSSTAFSVDAVSNVTLRSIRFVGRSTSPANTSPSFDHVAIRAARATDLRIEGCDFVYWRGAAIAITGSASDNYYAYRVKVTGCSFDTCYFGISIADRSEYSLLSTSHFTNCRLAIWHTSGNWMIANNVIVGCYGAYYSYAATSPYGALALDNWNHGSVTGNIFNHANGGGGTQWTVGAAFPIGGTPVDPGPGVVLDGLYPPSFTGNSLWYCNITARDLMGDRWLLSGCTISDSTVACSGTAPVHLVGNQSGGGASQPVLTGNVVNLLP